VVSTVLAVIWFIGPVLDEILGAKSLSKPAPKCRRCNFMGRLRLDQEHKQMCVARDWKLMMAPIRRFSYCRPERSMRWCAGRTVKINHAEPGDLPNKNEQVNQCDSGSFAAAKSSQRNRNDYS